MDRVFFRAGDRRGFEHGADFLAHCLFILTRINPCAMQYAVIVGGQTGHIDSDLRLLAAHLKKSLERGCTCNPCLVANRGCASARRLRTRVRANGVDALGCLACARGEAHSSWTFLAREGSTPEGGDACGSVHESLPPALPGRILRS